MTVKRNAQIVAGPNKFTIKDKVFLETFSDTLDVQQSLKASGLTKSQLNHSPFLLTQIDDITKLNMYSIRSRTVIGTHYRLLEKFETDYDEAKSMGDGKLQQGLASTLSRMTDTAMKASGDFATAKDQGAATNVQVVINMGTNKDNPSTDGTQNEQPVVDIRAVEIDE